MKTTNFIVLSAYLVQLQKLVKLIIYNNTGKKYFNLFTSKDFGFKEYDKDYVYDGTEVDVENDENVINDRTKKTEDELTHALKVFGKNKFNVI